MECLKEILSKNIYTKIDALIKIQNGNLNNDLDKNSSHDRSKNRNLAQ